MDTSLGGKKHKQILTPASFHKHKSIPDKL